MRKPQLCLSCHLETKELDIKISEKILYNVTVKSIDANGKQVFSISFEYFVFTMLIYYLSLIH